MGYTALARMLWKPALGLLVLALAWYALQSYGDRREAAGRDHVKAQWQADTLARDAATLKAAEAARAREDAAKAHNQESLRTANEQLQAIAADRSSLAGRLRDYENRLRSLAASQATGQRGIDALAGIAARTAEVDRLYDEYDRACQRDAVRFSALQEQLRPQL